MERLGIDLSWRSSQIEGNTYTRVKIEDLRALIDKKVSLNNLLRNL